MQGFIKDIKQLTIVKSGYSYSAAEKIISIADF